MGQRGPRRDTSRDASMIGMYQQGLTLEQVGSRYGVSRERVRQILQRNGLSGPNGGKAERLRQKAIQKEEREIRRWGMTYAQKTLLANRWLAKGERDPRVAFTEHKNNARKRGIAFQMTFADWMAVWGDAYGGRGRGSEFFVMCRYGDRGPYKLGNVYIATQNRNMLDYHARRRRTTTYSEKELAIP